MKRNFFGACFTVPTFKQSGHTGWAMRGKLQILLATREKIEYTSKCLRLQPTVMSLPRQEDEPFLCVFYKEPKVQDEMRNYNEVQDEMRDYNAVYTVERR